MYCSNHHKKGLVSDSPVASIYKIAFNVVVAQAQILSCNNIRTYYVKASNTPSKINLSDPKIKEGQSGMLTSGDDHIVSKILLQSNFL